jgi:hypothetical protein
MLLTEGSDRARGNLSNPQGQPVSIRSPQVQRGNQANDYLDVRGPPAGLDPDTGVVGRLPLVWPGQRQTAPRPT